MTSTGSRAIGCGRLGFTGDWNHSKWVIYKKKIGEAQNASPESKLPNPVICDECADAAQQEL